LPDQNVDIDLSDEVFILSPFDILNVFRHRLKDFFDFDYQIECFVPAAKRQYGYFSLPILCGDKFIARMDAKADRKAKVLIVHNIHFEPVDISETTIEKLTRALNAFVRFNKCDDIIFRNPTTILIWKRSGRPFLYRISGNFSTLTCLHIGFVDQRASN
jgi:uncharacterized protein YcaQ